MNKFKSLIESFRRMALEYKAATQKTFATQRSIEENQTAFLTTEICIRVAKETLFADLETRIRDEIVSELLTCQESHERNKAIEIVNATFSRWGFE